MRLIQLKKIVLAIFISLLIIYTCHPIAQNTTASIESHFTGNFSERLKINENNEELAAIGIPYSFSLPIGNSTVLKYYLIANKTYFVNLYGVFVDTDADYDVYIYNSDFTKIKAFLNDPGEEEQGYFKPKENGTYYFLILNNPKTSKSVRAATLTVFEYIFFSIPEKPFNITLKSLLGSNKTYTAPLYNSTYGFLLNVANLTDMKMTFNAIPTKNLAVQMALYQFTSKIDKLYYNPINSENDETIIDDDKGSLGEKTDVSFIVGRRNTEKANDTRVVLFIKVLKGSGNLTITVKIEKTNIQIDLLPYTTSILVSIIILALVIVFEEKLRGIK